MASNLRRLGRLTPSSSMLFVCDIQHAFCKGTYQMPTVIHGATTLVEAARAFQVPIVLTTQSVERHGGTVPELATRIHGYEGARTFDKTLFSMVTPEVEKYLSVLEARPTSVVLCGIEAHVCVLHTCLDLLHSGYDVHVVSDAVSNSTAHTRDESLERMRDAGAFLTSVESVVFQWTRDANDPKFTQMSKLVKDHFAFSIALDNGTEV